MNRKNTITLAEFNEIDTKLTELLELVDKFDYLYRDIDDLSCLSHSLFLIERNLVDDLKLID